MSNLNRPRNLKTFLSVYFNFRRKLQYYVNTSFSHKYCKCLNFFWTFKQFLQVYIFPILLSQKNLPFFRMMPIFSSSIFSKVYRCRRMLGNFSVIIFVVFRPVHWCFFGIDLSEYILLAELHPYCIIIFLHFGYVHFQEVFYFEKYLFSC